MEQDLRSQLIDAVRKVNLLYLFVMILYVSGVCLLVYAIMQLTHGLEGKDQSFIRRGIKFLIISVLLLVIRPVMNYLHLI